MSKTRVVQQHLVPVPFNFHPEQAWNAWVNGVPMLRQPPEHKPCPYGGGWAVFVSKDGVPTRVLSPGAAREIIGQSDPRSVWGEKRDEDGEPPLQAY